LIYVMSTVRSRRGIRGVLGSENVLSYRSLHVVARISQWDRFNRRSFSFILEILFSFLLVLLVPATKVLFSARWMTSYARMWLSRRAALQTVYPNSGRFFILIPVLGRQRQLEGPMNKLWQIVPQLKTDKINLVRLLMPILVLIIVGFEWLLC